MLAEETFFDAASEWTILAALCGNRGEYHYEELSPEKFFDEPSRKVFTAWKMAWDKGEKGPMAVERYLKDKDTITHYHKILQYENGHDRDTVNYHITQVCELYAKRKICNLVNMVELNLEGMPSDRIIDFFSDNLSRFYRQTAEHTTLEEALEKALAIIDKRRRGELTGLKLRWDKINQQFGGEILPPQHIVIGGESGSFKSTSALDLVTDIFDQNAGVPILVNYFSMEQGAIREAMRALSKYGRMTVQQIRSAGKKLTDQDFDKLQSIAQKIKDYNIRFVDASLSAREIRAKVMKGYWEMRSAFPDGNFFIINVLDHTQLAEAEEEKNDVDVVKNVSHTLMQVRNKIGCINILLSQYKAEFFRKMLNDPSYAPRKDDLYCPAVYQDADTVILLHRPELWHVDHWADIPTKDLIIWIFEKNRDGETGDVLMRHSGGLNRIEEMQTRPPVLDRHFKPFD